MRGIDPTTWTQVSPLLDEALDLSPEARQGFLLRLAGNPARTSPACSPTC